VGFADRLLDGGVRGGLSSGSFSPESPSFPEQIGETNVTGSTAPAEPPRRFPPSILVEGFAAGVNAEGGTWTCGRGKPFVDLAAALQPHAEKSGGRAEARCIELGERWANYCGGAPRDAWKAAAWLGEGAPERSRPAPAQAAEERADAVRRREHARSIERDKERAEIAKFAVGLPPELAATIAAIGRGSAGG
jgi:hypothetical protein